MSGSRKLAEEIARNAEKIPLESQEHILSVINAMIFTRETINREQAATAGNIHSMSLKTP